MPALAPTATGGAVTGDDCRTRDFISKFELVAAFDAVPAPAVAAVPGAPAPTTPAPTTPAPGTPAPTTPPPGDESAAGAQQEQVTSRQSAVTQSNEARQKADAVMGAGK